MEEVQEKLGNLHQRPFSGRVNHGPAFFVADLLVKIVDTSPIDAISKKLQYHAIN
jgi:hypothetical protein